MSEIFDVVVIGSGPGGYVCAIKAAQLGLKTAIVEKMSTFGGTCLNVGCIPSKALLHASEMFHVAGHELELLGVNVTTPRLDLAAMMRHKDKTVKANVGGVQYLLKKNKVTTFNGIGSISSADQVVVTNAEGAVQSVRTKNIVIATGSTVAGIPGVNFEFDESVIVSSTGALDLSEVPKRMIVVGGGVIGLELGSVWKRLGSEVIVIEYLDSLLGGMDRDVSKHFERILRKQGFDLRLSSKVTAISSQSSDANPSVAERAKRFGGTPENSPKALAASATGSGSASVTYEPVAGGESEMIEGDVVLVATGRKPYTELLGLENVGVETDRGKIKTNEKWQTNIRGIYAIGDVIAGPMLAHKAEDEGVAVAEVIAGLPGHVNYNVIPSVVYTQPEVASVGKTEEQLKSEGAKYNVGKFPFSANGRARAMNHTDGFVKILADAKTDRVLGAHIIGFGAGEMIHECALVIEFNGTSEDIALTCHAHPTMSEAVREAAMAAHDKPIHM